MDTGISYLPVQYDLWSTSQAGVLAPTVATQPATEFLADLSELSRNLSESGQYMNYPAYHATDQWLDSMATTRATNSTNNSSGTSSPLSMAEAVNTCERRRTQNRESQRAFRQRRTEYLHSLEKRYAEMQQKYQALEQDHAGLNEAYKQINVVVSALSERKEEGQRKASSSGRSNDFVKLEAVR